MNRGIKKFIYYVLDILLLLSALATVVSSYVVWFILPHGIGLHGSSAHCSGCGVGSTGNPEEFLGWFRYTWIDIHNWASVVLAIIIMAHILLHWNWIAKTTKRVIRHLRRPAGKVLELYGAALILFALFVFDCLSGLVLWLALPRGARDYNLMVSGLGRRFLGLQRNVWVDLHAWVAVTIVSIIIVHITMNWSWVVAVSKKTITGILRPAH
jgi:hypothetical protein